MKALRFALSVLLIVGCSACGTGGIKLMKPDYAKRCPSYTIIDKDGKVIIRGMYISQQVVNKWVLTKQVRKLENVTHGCIVHLKTVIDINTAAAMQARCNFTCELGKMFKYGGIGGVITGIIILAIAL